MSRLLSSKNFRYFTSSALKTLSGKGLVCPSCGCRETRVVNRKFLVTTLRRCADCCLLFRAPTSTADEFEHFYQREYASGFTTELPAPESLRAYLASRFAGTPKDFSHYLRMVKALGAKPGSRLLDLGCSWGYGAWQFQQAGYRVLGLELSQPRAEFARQQLGIEVVCDLNAIQEPVDIIFSSHVLEHIPNLRSILDFCDSQLNRDGGLFIAITPNGSADFRIKASAQWNHLWGFVHPLLLDVEFWQCTLQDKQGLISSDLHDLQAMHQWAEGAVSRIGNLSGWQLLVAYKAGLA